MRTGANPRRPVRSRFPLEDRAGTARRRRGTTPFGDGSAACGPSPRRPVVRGARALPTSSRKWKSMDKILRRAASATGVAVVAVSLAACSTIASSSTSDDAGTKSPVTFGVSAAETGQYAQYGQQFKEGFGLALSRINAKGGIDGHPV